MSTTSWETELSEPELVRNGTQASRAGADVAPACWQRQSKSSPSACGTQAEQVHGEAIHALLSRGGQCLQVLYWLSARDETKHSVGVKLLRSQHASGLACLEEFSFQKAASKQAGIL